MQKTELNLNGKKTEPALEQINRQVEQDREKIIHFFQNLPSVKHRVFPEIPAVPQTSLKIFWIKRGFAIKKQRQTRLCLTLYL